MTKRELREFADRALVRYIDSEYCRIQEEAPVRDALLRLLGRAALSAPSAEFQEACARRFGPFVPSVGGAGDG